VELDVDTVDRKSVSLTLTTGLTFDTVRKMAPHLR